jgi:P2-related tail formation protein
MWKSDKLPRELDSIKREMISSSITLPCMKGKAGGVKMVV